MTDQLDLLEPDQLARDYSAATGFSCFFLPVQDGGTHNSESAPHDDACPVCTALLQGQPTTTGTIHRFAAYQAERYGGRYVYFCSWSLLHWAAPIIRDGMLSGALICGPALLFEADTHYFEELTARFHLDAAALERLIPAVEKVPVITTERAGSLSQMLFLTALAASDNDSRAFFADRDAFEQQSRIGEYLQHIKTMEGEKRSDLEYPLEKERELLKLVAAGDRRGAATILDELLGIIFYTTGVNLEMIKSRVLELTVLLSRAALEGGADVEQIFGLNFHYLNQIRALRSVEELTRWTSRIITRFTDLVFVLRPMHHTNSILRATRHIREHFSGKISQSDVAEQVGLSTAYFSKLFKVEMQTTFTEYLTGVRVEAAKRLLLETEDRLGDVAFQCGFEDQSYFTKVFTRVVGITPSRYRSTGGRILHRDPAK